MELIEDLNILQRKALSVGLLCASLLLCIPFFFFFSWLSRLILGIPNIFFNYWWEPFFAPFALALLLVIHEGIHGFYFKLFKPENPLKYGTDWRLGLFNATSPGSRYPRSQMLIIYLAPFVLTSLLLTLLLALGTLSPLAYLFLAVIHTAMCVGDFYFSYLLLWKYRKYSILVEDTETGIKIFSLE
ncbi:DUF3267 domain-containing protein [Streptococcus sobrinus]|uniref:DUF3267 domain-containing protein n=1 Tax=Streptococcus sobrinus TaxID=1310 RepID=UPI000D6E7B3A|nr:DUF3267 domain-containing protein [Streptococcus sobrinus]AWN19828.1 transcriptional regulator [Streptococcus sobrinus]